MASDAPLPIRRLQWCEEALGRLGVEVPAGCRLLRMRSYLEAIESRPALLREARHRTLGAEAHRFGFEMMVILMAAVDLMGKESIFTREKLSETLRGVDQDHIGNPQARNTQFELFAPALLSVSGFDIRPGSTDAAWHLAGEQLALESKRMGTASLDSFRHRLEEAARQIRGPRSTGLIQVVRQRGLVLVNVDIYFTDVRDACSDSELIALMKERMHLTLNRMHHVAANHAIVGVLLFGHTKVWRSHEADLSRPRLTMSYPVLYNSFAGSDPAEVGMRRRLDSAIRAVERKMREIENSVPSWH